MHERGELEGSAIRQFYTTGRVGTDHRLITFLYPPSPFRSNIFTRNWSFSNDKKKKKSNPRWGGKKKTVPRVVTLPFRKICESNGGGKNCDLDASNFRSKSRFVSSWAKLRWKIKRKRLSETEIDVFRRVKRIFLLFSILLFRSVGWFSVKLNHVLETSLSVEL